jgi:hypothetical protein
MTMVTPIAMAMTDAMPMVMMMMAMATVVVEMGVMMTPPAETADDGGGGGAGSGRRRGEARWRGTKRCEQSAAGASRPAAPAGRWRRAWSDGSRTRLMRKGCLRNVL